ncbi:MAG: penicillin-binding protein 2 [Candidatus Margulisbacteria bacterium]|nr:penicillin-binding protein 2 [Candidatus Margulisiibacteriota bacterium]
MTPDKNRVLVYKLGFALIICILITRLAFLQILNHTFYKKKSENELNKIVQIYPNRGNIYDQNKIPLAITRTAYSVYMNRKEIDGPEKTAQTLSTYLEIPYNELYAKIKSRGNFVWIKRKITKGTYQALRKEKLEGIYFVKDEERIYPFQNIASDILGYVGSDNQGLGGLEHYYDKLLKGTPGKIAFEGDARRNRLVTGKLETLQHPYDGNHIITTLDYYVQYVTQKYLKENVVKNRADKGSAIVIDIKTGDILAMSDYPDFNANSWKENAIGTRKNSSVSDVYEPGSIFKLITVSAVLNEGLVKPDTVLTVPETLTLYNHTIKEAHHRPLGESNQKTVTQIIEESLNVGTALLAQKLGKEKLYAYIKAFGIGNKTGIELPGESQGMFRHLKNWSGLDLSIMAFGQGVAVTPIQIARAVASIANDGVLVEPHIVKYITDNEEKTLRSPIKASPQRLISSKTSKMVTKIMTETVDRGTGMVTKIDGYKIAGKTGTAQKSGEHGYEMGRYVASFIGFFPAEKPRFLVLVSIDSPRTSIYGASVAGPAFRDITKSLIDHYNIPPSYTPSQNLTTKKP